MAWPAENSSLETLLVSIRELEAQLQALKNAADELAAYDADAPADAPEPIDVDGELLADSQD